MHCITIFGTILFFKGSFILFVDYRLRNTFKHHTHRENVKLRSAADFEGGALTLQTFLRIFKAQTQLITGQSSPHSGRYTQLSDCPGRVYSPGA